MITEFLISKFQNMNSKHSIFKVLVLTVALFVGCNQEETNDLQVTSETVNGFLKYELDRSSLAFNEEDKDDEAINWKLIEIAGKLQFIISDVELRQSIASTVQGSVKEYVSLRDLSEKFPEVAQLFNQSDFKSGFNDDVFSFLHLGNDYEPVITIPNLNNADFNQAPLISPGIEVEDDDERGIRDCIFAWFYADDDNFVEVVIGEEQALNVSNPLFVITPHPVEGDNAKDRSSLPSIQEISDVVQFRANTEYHSHEFKINHRYEASGSSEFCVTAARIDPGGPVTGLVLRRDNGTYQAWKQIAAVNANDIGEDLTHWEQISDDYDPRADYRIFFNTFERDWYSSPKDLGEGNAYGSTVFLEGKRKYSNEWYAFDPNNSVDKRLNINLIYSNWLRTFSNSKGYLKVWRVEL